MAKQKRSKKQLVLNMIIAVVIAAVLVIAYQSGFMKKVEYMGGDFITTNFKKKNAGKNIVYAMTSQRCITTAAKKYNMGWPWKRATYDKLVRFLKLCGAKLTVFDSVMSEKSVYKCKNQGNDDEYFAIGMKDTKNVIIGYIFSTSEKDFRKSAKKVVNRPFKKTIDPETNKIIDPKTKKPIDPILRMKKLNKKVENIQQYNQNFISKNNLSKEEIEETQKQVHLIKTKVFSNLKNKDLTTEEEKKLHQAYQTAIITKYYNMFKKQFDKPLLNKNSIAAQNVNEDNSIPKFYRSTFPIKRYMEESDWLGLVQGGFDKDGTVRRITLLNDFYGKYYPSLSFAAAYRYLNPKHIEIGENYIKMDDRVIPLTKQGDLRLKYYNSYDKAYVRYDHIDMLLMYDHINKLYKEYQKLTDQPSIKYENLFYNQKLINQMREALREINPKLLKEAKKSLIKKFDRNSFQGKIVFMGATATSLKDIRATPFSQNDAGVHIHATATDNILQNDFIIEVSDSIYILIAIVTLTLLIGFLSANLSMLSNTIIAILFLLGIAFGSVALYHYSDILVNAITPFLAVLLPFLVITGINYFRESKEKKYIQNAFGQYLSPKVVEILVEDPTKMELGGQKKQITAFFSDVQGFSTISEALTPTELVNLLNIYLTEMCDVIGKYDGTVDKFEGDAIIGFWGAPLEEPNHAKFACYSTVEMQYLLHEMRKKWKAEGKPSLIADMQMRIGLNSGDAVVGNMGSQKEWIIP